MSGRPMRVSQTDRPRRRVALAWPLLAGLALALAGCQRTEDGLTKAAIEQATRAQAGLGYEARSAATGDGPLVAEAGASLPLPSDFPQDVYLPERYAVNSVMDLPDVSVVNLSAPGEVSALFSAARARMQAQGWTQTLAAQHSTDAAMLAFEKPVDGARRGATLSFNRSNGGGEVVVGVQLRKSQVR